MSSQVTLGISMETSLIPLGSTSPSALVKSIMVTFMVSSISAGMGASRSSFIMCLLRHFMAASLASAARSAPTNPCVMRARTWRSTSSARGMLRVWTPRMDSLP